MPATFGSNTNESRAVSVTSLGKRKSTEKPSPPLPPSIKNIALTQSKCLDMNHPASINRFPRPASKIRGRALSPDCDFEFSEPSGDEAYDQLSNNGPNKKPQRNPINNSDEQNLVRYLADHFSEKPSERAMLSSYARLVEKGIGNVEYAWALSHSAQRWYDVYSSRASWLD